jgi:hypothetical protein
MKKNMEYMKNELEKGEEIVTKFRHFFKNEWLFDNKSAMNIMKHMTEAELSEFNFDIMRIKWKMYIMNHAYGIKKFILKEEAELPSVGYNDIVTFMSNRHGENYLPFLKRGKELKTKTPEEIK